MPTPRALIESPSPPPAYWMHQLRSGTREGQPFEGGANLATDASTVSHPSLLQFIAVEAGLGKITNGIPFARVLANRGASLDRPFVAAASVGARKLLGWFLEEGVNVHAMDGARGRSLLGQGCLSVGLRGSNRGASW